MPYSVIKSQQCPAGKPWACIKSSDGKIMGCHATKAQARDQQQALYAAEKKK